MIVTYNGRRIQRQVTLRIESRNPLPPAPSPDRPNPEPTTPILNSVRIELSPSGQVQEGTRITASAIINDPSIRTVSYS